ARRRVRRLGTPRGRPCRTGRAARRRVTRRPMRVRTVPPASRLGGRAAPGGRDSLSAVDVAALKQRVIDDIDKLADRLLEVSHDIHEHPELGFEEHHAHRRLTDELERAGLPVTRAAYDLPTAFDARVGAEGPTVAVICEYDALPGLGHACGHNIIAAAGLGAALALAPLADELGG